MAKSRKLDYWRKYFGSANCDIFEVIECAIVVAASDWPKEFRLQRDRIAQILFSCRLSRCLGCDKVEVMLLEEEEENGCDKGEHDEDVRLEDVGSGLKENKVDSSSGDRVELNQLSNYSYVDTEALTEEIEEGNLTIKEVLRIKEILSNFQDESDGFLFESLRRLQLMKLTFGTLKITEIGKAVNGLRKHASRQIRHLVRTLIMEWKNIVDEWVIATTAVAGNSPDSVNPSVVIDEGLPSPPLDEGAFMAAQMTSMELSQFFDGMDDDESLQNSAKLNNKHDAINSIPGNHMPHSKLQKLEEDNAQEDWTPMSKLMPVSRQVKASIASSGRPLKSASQIRPNRNVNKSDQKLDSEIAEMKGRASEVIVDPEQHLDLETYKKNKKSIGSTRLLEHHSDSCNLERKLPYASQNKLKNMDEMSVLVKLEATKRKLQEGYQQAENAKKQRTIQVMDLQDLPKQSLAERNFHPKHGIHNRHFSSVRR